MYVCMYVCMYVYPYVYINVVAYMCVYIYIIHTWYARSTYLPFSDCIYGFLVWPVYIRPPVPWRGHLAQGLGVSEKKGYLVLGSL